MFTAKYEIHSFRFKQRAHMHASLRVNEALLQRTQIFILGQNDLKTH